MGLKIFRLQDKHYRKEIDIEKARQFVEYGKR